MFNRPFEFALCSLEWQADDHIYDWNFTLLTVYNIFDILNERRKLIQTVFGVFFGRFDNSARIPGENIDRERESAHTLLWNDSFFVSDSRRENIFFYEILPRMDWLHVLVRYSVDYQILSYNIIDLYSSMINYIKLTSRVFDGNSL